ncbi:hypothetical protein Syun_019432 [Stephania yunnanensis]|uniref:Uncharacterized protein n=1 Tax=Stephania yunnanensis TaxID=152371 RepID=A0AAP0IVB0_9MAGN
MANGGHHNTVLITGVGRGLGRALAIEMARRGHIVFGFSRDFYDLESLGLILYSDPDHRHVLFHLDVRDDEAISLFNHNAIGLVGVLDIIEMFEVLEEPNIQSEWLKASKLLPTPLVFRISLWTAYGLLSNDLLLMQTFLKGQHQNVASKRVKERQRKESGK